MQALPIEGELCASEKVLESVILRGDTQTKGQFDSVTPSQNPADMPSNKSRGKNRKVSFKVEDLKL